MLEQDLPSNIVKLPSTQQDSELDKAVMKLITKLYPQKTNKRTTDLHLGTLANRVYSSQKKAKST